MDNTGSNCIAILIDRRSGLETNVCRYATSLGREIGNDIIVSGDKTVSRQHANIQYVDGKFYVQDLGSKNGTRINGERIEKLEMLRSGDELTLGLSQFIFVLLPAKMLGASVSSKRTETIAEPAKPCHVPG